MDAIKILGGLLGNRQMARDVGREVLSDLLGKDKKNKKRRKKLGLGKGYSSRQLQTNRQRGYGRDNYRGGVTPRGAGYGSGLPYQPQYVPPGARNRQAIVLIRAMINAAKADGNIDRDEYNTIAQQTHGLGPAELDFLRRELDCPLDLQQFLSEVPRGLEIEVYRVSLAAIRPDCEYERRYLHDLAHGLGLTHHTCNQIHRRMGLPALF